MEQLVFFTILIFAIMSIGLIIRRIKKKNFNKPSTQRHRPHSPSAGNSEARRLQNGGTIGPGKLGGGADFGPTE